jgi:hypothetical protein
VYRQRQARSCGDSRLGCPAERSEADKQAADKLPFEQDREGHEFIRAVKSLKKVGASAPEVCTLPTQVFQQPTPRHRLPNPKQKTDAKQWTQASKPASSAHLGLEPMVTILHNSLSTVDPAHVLSLIQVYDPSVSFSPAGACIESCLRTLLC